MENNKGSFNKKIREEFAKVSEQVDLVQASFILFNSENDMKMQQEQRNDIISMFVSNIGLGDDEKGEALINKVKDIGLNKLKDYTEEELRLLLISVGYQDIVDSLDLHKFIECIGDVIDNIDELDTCIDNYKEEIAKIKEEMKLKEDQITDIHDLLISTLDRLSKEDHSEAVDNVMKLITNSIENAITLKPVIDLYTDIGGKNTLIEYKIHDRRQPNLNKYNDALRRSRVKATLSKFVEMDINQYLKDEYKDLPKGFLIYTIMKYIGGRSFTATKQDIRMFLVQLNTNFYQLFTNTLSEKNREKFIESLNNLAAIFVK